MRFAYRLCYYVIKRSYTVRRDTLQLKFLNYFRSSVEYKKITLQNWNTNFSNNEVLKNIRENSVVSSFSIEELSSTLYYLGKEQSLFGAQFCDRRASVDKACSDRLPNLSREEILILLDAWMYALPNRITFTNFYLLTLRRFDTWFRDKDLSLYEWVLCIFYIGLGKRRNQTLMTKAINYFDHRHLIKQLSKLELCVFFNSAYKTGARITSPVLLDGTVEIMKRDMNEILLDPSVFITIIKLLRHSKHHDKALMQQISYLFMSSRSLLQGMNFTFKVHLLAIYADAKFYIDFVKNLIDSCFTDLTNVNTSLSFMSYFTEYPRAKDITRFLWAVSCLGCSIDNNLLDNVISQVIHRHCHGEYENHPEEIVGTLLFLWMLGCKPLAFFEKVITVKLLQQIKGKNRIRYNSRLCLLLSAAQIEAPHIVKDAELWKEKNHLKIVNPNLDIHLKNRDAFMKVLEAVKNLASTLGLANVKWEFTVPHIYIAGITAESMNGYLINIEVLDSTLCLYESEFPEGLMKFKLRLSEALGYLNIIIQEKDVKKNLDTENLYSYIEDILRRVINNERWDVEH